MADLRVIETDPQLAGRFRDDRLALSPAVWREVLRTQLIDSGFEHDIAGLISRRVIERLVEAYLGGSLPEEAPTTRSLDEAA